MLTLRNAHSTSAELHLRANYK